MKKLTIYTSLFLTTLLLAWACRKEKPGLGISDKDPCSCASEVSAEFTIVESKYMPSNQGLYTLTDDITGGTNVVFTSLEEDAEYTWYIGAEILNNKSVTRYFQTNLIGQTLPITLVVRKQPNNTCFPNDDGYDSIVKYITVHDACNNHPLSGVFRMAPQNSTDSIDIRIEQATYNTTLGCNNFIMENFDNAGGFCTGQYHDFLVNYREIKTIDLSALESQCPNRSSVYLMRMEFDGSFYLDIGYRIGPDLPWGPNTYSVRIELYGRKLN
jgi:hypothetical protein